MNELLTALITRLLTLAALGERIYLDLAPDGTAFPFLVYSVDPSDGPDRVTDNKSLRDYPVRFNVYGNAGAAAITTIMRTVETSLIDTPLTLATPAYLIDSKSSDHTIELDPDKDDDGKDIYIVRLLITFTVQTPR